MIEDGGVGGGSSPEIRPKADILTLKLREEAIVDEMLLDTARAESASEVGEEAVAGGLLLEATGLGGSSVVFEA